MNTKQTSIKQALRLALAISLFAILLAPSSALAATAAGTQIINTATVTWATNPTGVSDSVTVTVELLPAAPTVAYVSTNPTSASNPAEGVSSASSVDVVYTVTSGANGGDDYDLSWTSTDTTVTADTPDGGNATTILDLGGSVISGISGQDITVPGVLTDHGLASGEIVVIGGVTYTINASAPSGSDTVLTLSAIPAGAVIGDPVYERVQLTLTTVVGTPILPATAGNHAMALTVTSQTDGAATATENDPTLYVVAVALTIDKTANVATAQPGDTISYSIDVSNTTTASAATVIITDPIPAFTDFNGGVVDAGGVCTPSYSNTAAPYVWGYAPGALPDAAVTAVRFECGSLAAAATVTVGFDVQVEN